MSASMNNMVIEEGEILTRIHIPRDSYIWDTPFKFYIGEINVTLDIIQSQQVSQHVFPSILKVVKNN